MKKFLVPVFLCCMLALSACISKNSRLSSDTLTITIDPSTPQTLNTGETLALKAIAKSAKSDNVDISPSWSVENGLGTFSPTSGKSTTFTATTAGAGNIFASYQGVRGSVSMVVSGPGTSGDYVIFDDTFRNIDGVVDVFGVNYALGMILDSTVQSQGFDSWKTTFTVTGPLAYAGWFVGKFTDTNMSAFSSGHIKFDIRTPCDIQIGIRSSNINSNSNAAKVYISDVGISPNASAFQSVSIPISTLVINQPGTDLTKIVDLFIIAVVATKTGTLTDQTFWIDNIRWTRN